MARDKKGWLLGAMASLRYAFGTNSELTTHQHDPWVERAGRAIDRLDESNEKVSLILDDTGGKRHISDMDAAFEAFIEELKR